MISFNIISIIGRKLSHIRHNLLALINSFANNSSCFCGPALVASPSLFCVRLFARICLAGELLKSRVEGVGEPQNQQAQKGSQTPQNTLPKIFNIYNTNR